MSEMSSTSYPEPTGTREETTFDDISDRLDMWQYMNTHHQDEFRLFHNFRARTVICKEVTTASGDQLWNCKMLTPDDDKPRHTEASEIAMTKDDIPEAIRKIAQSVFNK